MDGSRPAWLSSDIETASDSFGGGFPEQLARLAVDKIREAGDKAATRTDW